MVVYTSNEIKNLPGTTPTTKKTATSAQWRRANGILAHRQRDRERNSADELAVGGRAKKNANKANILEQKHHY